MLNRVIFPSGNYAPKMYKDMADKRMNEFQQVADAEYVYAEAADGSQIKMEWNNIIKKIIPKLLENKNFLPDNASLDTIENAFGYAYGYNDNSGIWGPFISFGAEGYQVQLKFDYKGEGIKFRVKYKDEDNNPQYTLWRAISFCTIFIAPKK